MSSAHAETTGAGLDQPAPQTKDRTNKNGLGNPSRKTSYPGADRPRAGPLVSANLCDGTHLSALAGYALRHKIWAPDSRQVEANDCPWAAILGEILHAANVVSVQVVYAAKPQICATLIGSPPRTFLYSGAAASRDVIDILPPVAVVKSAQCYRYNADSGPEWENSVADIVSLAILNHAITRLPGYEAAQWGAPTW